MGCTHRLIVAGVAQLITLGTRALKSSRLFLKKLLLERKALAVNSVAYVYLDLPVCELTLEDPLYVSISLSRKRLGQGTTNLGEGGVRLPANDQISLAPFPCNLSMTRTRGHLGRSADTYTLRHGFVPVHRIFVPRPYHS